MATSEQVAKLAGVSRATVSRTLNGSSKVSDKTKQRIFNIIATLEHDKHSALASHSRPSSSMIALALFNDERGLNFSRLTKTSSYFYLNLCKNLEEAVAEAHYDLFLPSGRHASNETPEEAQVNYLRSLQVSNTAGVLAVSVSATDPRIQALHQSSLPTIFVDSILQGKQATWVKSDYTDGARQAVEHLLRLGHQRIAFFHGDTALLSNAERLLGWQQALARAGLALDPQLVRLCGWDTRDAYQAAMKLLSERRDFTAIAAGSDMMALGIIHALHNQGLKIPEDISLIGFDDIDYCEDVDPPLTTIHQDVAILSKEAVSRLLHYIEGDNTPTPLLVPTQLIVRRSTRLLS